MNRNFVKKYITTFSIILFLVLYSLINSLKPAFMYNSDGTLREFGIGLKKNTVIPAWLMAIILAIFSYYSILYYIFYPKIKNY